MTETANTIKYHPDHFKYGLAYSFPGTPDEVLFDTEAEALAFLADYTEATRVEIGDGMHLLTCESWYPDVEGFGDSVIEKIDEAFAEITGDYGSTGFLGGALTNGEVEAFREELDAAVKGVVARHIKPIALWEQDRFVTWEDAEVSR